VNITTALITFTAFLLASEIARCWCGTAAVWCIFGGGVAENLSVFLVLVALGLGSQRGRAAGRHGAVVCVAVYLCILKGVEQ
jgi:hypothetical protein